MEASGRLGGDVGIWHDLFHLLTDLPPGRVVVLIFGLELEIGWSPARMRSPLIIVSAPSEGP